MTEVPEIEMTPDMIEAGAEVAWRAPIMEPDEPSMRKMVTDVFLAVYQLPRQARPS